MDQGEFPEQSKELDFRVTHYHNFALFDFYVNLDNTKPMLASAWLQSVARIWGISKAD